MKKLLSNLRKNKIFWILIVVVFLLHILTYPSIHFISDDYTYLASAQKICRGNFSDFLSENPEYYSHNTPLYPTIVCLFSPLHGFNIYRAELVSFSFLIFMVLDWSFLFPKEWKVNKKAFSLLLFSNSLLWAYSLRVLIDVTFSFFFSIGTLCLYYFFESKNKKYYYLAFSFLSLALLTKESAVLFFPVFLIYLLIKRNVNLKNLILLSLPFIPIGMLTIYQFLKGFPIFDILLYNVRSTTTLDYSTIPYSKLPTGIFVLGIFGPGIISLLWAWKNIRKMQNWFKSFLFFILIFYLIWELNYDFITFTNAPRYHTTLMPFLSLIISQSASKKKSLKYIYYLSLVYTLTSGFLIAYYFHVESLEIWKVSFKDLIKTVI